MMNYAKIGRAIHSSNFIFRQNVIQFLKGVASKVIHF